MSYRRNCRKVNHWFIRSMNRTGKFRLLILAVVMLLLYVIFVHKPAYVTSIAPTVPLTSIVLNDKTKLKTLSNSEAITTLKQAVKEYNRPDEFPEFFIPRPVIVNPMDFVEMTKPNTVQCDSKNPPFLTVLVLTMHTHVAYRDAIRQTWGSEASKVVFLAGLNKNESLNANLIKEAERTKDIVMFDFQESYFNLTYKVLMGFKWIKEHCNGTKYVMKVDEDTFVDINSIYKKLQSPLWNDKICGPYYTGEHCQRAGKYKVLISSYPFKLFVPHVKGNMYLMPKDIAMKLLNVSYYMPYCNMEDAYITGTLAKSVGGIKYKSILGTYYYPSGPYKGCRFIKSQKLVSQGFGPPDFQELWKLMKSHAVCK